MNLNFEKSLMGVMLTLALLFSCPLSGRLQNTEPIHASEQAQNSGQYDYSQLPWIMNLVSVTTYDSPAGNTQYAYHIVGKLESGPIEYNRVVGQFDNLKIEEKFTEKRPCCCDDGQTEDGKLHYHGHCVECCPLHSEKARAEKKAVAAGWDEDVYQKHIALEGSNTWNEHPDGCFYCGSSDHHSQDCPDKQLYWQSH